MILSIPLPAQEFSDRWRTGFLDPPDEYRPVPFWHLNGMLTTGEIARQVDAAKFAAGFGGVTVLPVSPGPQHPTGLPCPGMTPPFLSREYFDRYRDILSSAAKDSLQVILYDDIDFPSGLGGNKMKELYPEDTRKELVRMDTLVTGPAEIRMDLPDGSLMSVVAMGSKPAGYKDLSRFVDGRKLIWNAPAGPWRILIFTCRLNGDGHVDYMDTLAVQKYLPLTYGEYDRQFADYFGRTIRQVFFDDVGYVAMERGWSPAFNQTFQRRFGRDPSVYYPALWEDIGTETAAARVALFDTRAEMLAEGYPRLVGEWSKSHGLKSSGHPPGNYQIQPVDMSFDIFKFYRHVEIPVTDYIFYRTHGRDGFKLVSSAADSYDKPVVAAEVCGAFLENDFDTLMLYRTAMEVFTRGVNFIIPHGMWYDYRPESVRIPPLISPFSAKTGPALKSYSEFVARCCFLLQGGRRVSEIAIFYPVASLQAWFTFNSGKTWGTNAPPEADYLSVGDMLTRQIHRDFTFIHPETWTGDRCGLDGRTIRMNNALNSQDFKLLILPGGKVISTEALRKIKKYYDQGGKIIATSMLPVQSAEFGKDAEVIRLVTEIFGFDPTGPVPRSVTAVRKSRAGGSSAFIPFPDAANLSDMIRAMDIPADVVFDHDPVPVSGDGELTYIHKIRDGRGIYYFTNSGNENLNTVVELRGKVEAEFWHPESGRITSLTKTVSVRHGDRVYTRFSLELPAVSSLFVVETKPSQ